MPERIRIQRKKAGITDHERVSPALIQGALASGGQPLDTATRAIMEPRFGHSFGDVRVHDGGMAMRSANALDARAYTVGSDIVFNTGEYDPSAQAGQQLLAHELAHVVQQAPSTAVGEQIAVSQPGDALERSADRAASQVMAGQSVDAGAISSSQSTPGIQRKEEEQEPTEPIEEIIDEEEAVE